MAFDVEDGTGKATANSFATVVEAQEFADERGFTLPTDSGDIEQLLVQAGDYLLGMETQFKGQRTNDGQRMPFPRVGVLLYQGVESIDNDEIPERLKEAQIRLAISGNSTTLVPDGAGREVIRKKIGPLETQYGESGSGTVNPQFNQAMDLLAPFLHGEGSAIIRVERM